MAVPCIMFRVRNHYNGSALFIQVSEQLHYFITIAESRLPVGSSASISLGLFTTARATATRCC